MAETQITFTHIPPTDPNPTAADLCRSGFTVTVAGQVVATALAPITARAAFDVYLENINVNSGDGPEHALHLTNETAELVRIALSPPDFGGMGGGSNSEFEAEVIWREALQWRAQLLYRLVRSFSPETVAIIDAVARVRGLRLVPRSA